MQYPGGKNSGGAYQTIINQIPPHDIFVEAFAGSAPICRHKRPARQSYLIELDPTAAASLTPLCDRTPGDPRVICADATRWLATHALPPRAFVYCDPPYPAQVRSGTQRRIYRCELLTSKQHIRLLEVLLTLECPVMISSYPNDLYNRALQSWRTLTYKAITRGGTIATECLWMNYPEPIALHDYTYLGTTWRHRQNVRRMQKRWTARLERMPLLHKQALLAALDALPRS